MSHKTQHNKRLLCVLATVLAMLAATAVSISVRARTETEVSGNAYGVSSSGAVTIAPTRSITLPTTEGTETDSVSIA